jgi:4-hydroxybenzoate polyprenyltransferase
MIELDEKDIKAIARSRFTRKHNKKFSVVLGACLAAFIGILFLTNDLEGKLYYTSLVPLVVGFIYIIQYFRNMDKAEKELVNYWQKE